MSSASQRHSVPASNAVSEPAGEIPVLRYDDHADSMSVEIEMRDIMGGEQPAHAHSMDDVNLMLDDAGGGQVLSVCQQRCVIASSAWCRPWPQALHRFMPGSQRSLRWYPDTDMKANGLGACAGSDQSREEARQPIPWEGAVTHCRSPRCHDIRAHLLIAQVTQ